MVPKEGLYLYMAGVDGLVRLLDRELSRKCGTNEMNDYDATPDGSRSAVRPPAKRTLKTQALNNSEHYFIIIT